MLLTHPQHTSDQRRWAGLNKAAVLPALGEAPQLSQVDQELLELLLVNDNYYQLIFLTPPNETDTTGDREEQSHSVGETCLQNWAAHCGVQVVQLIAMDTIPSICVVPAVVKSAAPSS
ncbi:hypothetical protein VDGL01_01227 [Verticillium dahliae]